MICSRRGIAFHLGALGIALTQSAPAPAAPAVGEPNPPPLSGEVLAKTEAMLEQLRTAAAAEPGPVVPRPSDEVAYFLLAGLAGQRREIIGPEDIGRPENVVHRVVELAPDARVELEERPIQDKAGSYVTLTARLLRKRGGNWIERGKGRSIRG